MKNDGKPALPRSRGELRRYGEWLDGPGRSARAELVAEARRKGIDVPEDWETLSGKRLIRICLGRSEDAQRAANPIARDEAFTCVHCGADVPPGGRHPRDHCPFCLHALHVDGDVPGDRASTCQGLLVPRALERRADHLSIVYVCAGCGVVRRNRVLDDVTPPDNPARVLALAALGPYIGQSPP